MKGGGRGGKESGGGRGENKREVYRVEGDILALLTFLCRENLKQCA